MRALSVFTSYCTTSDQCWSVRHWLWGWGDVEGTVDFHEVCRGQFAVYEGEKHVCWQAFFFKSGNPEIGPEVVAGWKTGRKTGSFQISGFPEKTWTLERLTETTTYQKLFICNENCDFWAQGPPFSKIGSKMVRIQNFRNFLFDLFIITQTEPRYQNLFVCDQNCHFWAQGPPVFKNWV